MERNEFIEAVQQLAVVQRRINEAFGEYSLELDVSDAVLADAVWQGFELGVAHLAARVGDVAVPSFVQWFVCETACWTKEPERALERPAYLPARHAKDAGELFDALQDYLADKDHSQNLNFKGEENHVDYD